MISAVAFCPQAPVLVRELAQGAAVELADLRAACRTAIRAVAAPGRKLLVLGSGPQNRLHDANARGTFAGLGLPLEVPLGSDEPGPVELPLSLTVGAWLLRDALGPNCGATGWSVGPDLENRPDQLDTGEDEVGLVVLGDGSARRTLKAPGYLDDRAAVFDAALGKALTSGDGRRLHRSVLGGTQAGHGSDLLVSGTPAWHEAARALHEGQWDADLLYDDAPYGVGYFAAVWTARA